MLMSLQNSGVFYVLKLFHENNCIVRDCIHSMLPVNDLLCPPNAKLHYITPMTHSTHKVLLQWH